MTNLQESKLTNAEIIHLGRMIHQITIVIRMTEVFRKSVSNKHQQVPVASLALIHECNEVLHDIANRLDETHSITSYSDCRESFLKLRSFILNQHADILKNTLRGDFDSISTILDITKIEN